VKISVEDAGRGISPDDKDKLLLPYFSTKGGGTGIAIAACIIADHGGTIHLQDNFPVGACFQITLPAGDVPASTNSPASLTV